METYHSLLPYKAAGLIDRRNILLRIQLEVVGNAITMYERL